jgi:urease accessory protein UreF
MPWLVQQNRALPVKVCDQAQPDPAWALSTGLTTGDETMTLQDVAKLREYLTTQIAAGTSVDAIESIADAYTFSRRDVLLVLADVLRDLQHAARTIAWIKKL